MDYKYLQNIIKLGKSETVEFKSSFNDSAIETITAFSNNKGGYLFIGLNNVGEPIKGFSIGIETLQKWLNEIKVQEFPIKPVGFKGIYFKRLVNSNQQLSLIQIADLNLQSLQVSWDSYPSGSNTINVLDNDKILKFLQKVNTMGRFHFQGSPMDFLRKLKLISGNLVTNAAYLLFAKEEIEYNIHMGRFKSESLIIDDRIIKLSLFEAVETTMKYIISQIKVAFEIKGMPTQRNEIYEYPLPALRELVLNTIIHRDYMSPIDLQIKIFDNKITLYNPGKLYGDLTIADLKTEYYQANARNKLIAEAFYLTGDIEKYGSGFKRIASALKEYPTMQLDFREIPNGFYAEINYT